MGSMHLGLEGLSDDGEALAAFYRERALGGAALIVTGGSAVSRVGAGGRNYSFVNEDSDAAKLSRVAAAVHDAGALVLLQLFHAGRYAYEASFGLTPVAPSAVYSRYSRCEPRALSGDEVLATIEDFRSGAPAGPRAGVRRGRDHGVRGVPRRPVPGAGDEPPRRRMGRGLRAPHGVRAAGRRRRARGRRARAGGRVPAVGGQLRAKAAARRPTFWTSRGRSPRMVRSTPSTSASGWHEARVPTVQALVPHGAWRPMGAGRQRSRRNARHRFQPDQYGGARRRGARCRRRGLRLDGAAVPGRPGDRRQGA